MKNSSDGPSLDRQGRVSKISRIQPYSCRKKGRDRETETQRLKETERVLFYIPAVIDSHLTGIYLKAHFVKRVKRYSKRSLESAVAICSSGPWTHQSGTRKQRELGEAGYRKICTFSIDPHPNFPPGSQVRQFLWALTRLLAEQTLR
jgi:hypothetical protein